MSLLEEFIEQSNECSDTQVLFNLYTKAIAHMGFDSAVYTFLTDHPTVAQKAGHGVQSNYPSDWMSYYIEMNYQSIDPVVQTGLISNNTFKWQTLMESKTLSAKQHVFMQQAEEAGLKNGIGIPLHRANGEIAGVGLASEFTFKVDNIILAKLKLLTEQFHMVYCDLLSTDSTPSPQEIRLTEKEKEILKWLAVGKSYQDIADILGCSHRTIKFHLMNTYSKLNAHEKIFAVTKAIRLGLISVDTFGLPTLVKS